MILERNQQKQSSMAMGVSVGKGIAVAQVVKNSPTLYEIAVGKENRRANYVVVAENGSRCACEGLAKRTVD
jgi:hypothetical protein